MDISHIKMAETQNAPIEFQQFVYDLCCDLTQSEDRANNELEFYLA